MLPTFLGLGAPKCATTWLFQCLQAHPEVYVADVKETNFFIFDTIEGRLDEYRTHFEAAANEQAVGEISVSYWYSKVAPARVYKYLPDCRLFVSLRNPVEQIYSLYWHRQRQNFHRWDLDLAKNVDSFEAALDVFSEELVEPCRHYRNIRRWLDYFPPSQLLVLLLDDIKDDPANQISRLYSHIGVDSSFEPDLTDVEGRQARQGTSPRGPMIERSRQILYHFLVRYAYQPLKQVVGQYTADRIKETLGIRRLMEKGFRRQGYPEMAPSTRRRLEERFENEIRSLSSLLGRDLSHWTADE